MAENENSCGIYCLILFTASKNVLPDKTSIWTGLIRIHFASYAGIILFAITVVISSSFIFILMKSPNRSFGFNKLLFFQFVAALPLATETDGQCRLLLFSR